MDFNDFSRGVLGVHYNSIKCCVSFSQVSVSTIFRSGGHFLYGTHVKNVPAYNSAKIIETNHNFPKL